jgi:hypothetical protein
MIRACFSSSTCFISSGVQGRRSGPSCINLRNKDLVLRAYESIHNEQYPTKLRKFLNSCFVPGSRRPVIPSTLSGPIFYWPLLIKCPRYFISVSANCKLFFEIWSPGLPKKFVKLMVVLITSSWLYPYHQISQVSYIFLVTWGVVIPLGILIRKLNISHWDILSPGTFVLPDSCCCFTDHGSFLPWEENSQNWH